MTTLRTRLTTAALLALSSPAFAQLPTPAAPTSPNANTGWLGTFQGYMNDGVQLIVLGIGAILFIAPAIAGIRSYMQWSNGERIDAGDVAFRIGAGAIVALIGTFMMGIASGVL